MDGAAGYSRSVDGGATFNDLQAIGAPTRGDPSLAWREADLLYPQGRFFFSNLYMIQEDPPINHIGMWVSDDDCQTFSLFSNPAHGGSDDKEMMAIDNTGGDFDGRIYVSWIDFTCPGGCIMSTFSSNDGASWSAPLQISSPDADARGPWPAVAPNGDVFVAWLRYYDTDPTLKPIPEELDIEIARSTDGGQSFSQVSSPASGRAVPRDWFTSNNTCWRPALPPHIRMDPFPQVAVGPDGTVHVVYAYDPDGLGQDNLGFGDRCDVFYRRSTDSGTTWEQEVRLNDDATLRDQWFPSLSVSPENVVVAAWYDRRGDDANTLLEFYARASFNGGVTWGQNILLSDQPAQIADYEPDYWCYHGDYDQQVQSGTLAHILWSDERTEEGNVYWDSLDLTLIFADGFESGDTSQWRSAAQ